jgi:hypothetical protein
MLEKYHTYCCPDYCLLVAPGNIMNIRWTGHDSRAPGPSSARDRISFLTPRVRDVQYLKYNELFMVLKNPLDLEEYVSYNILSGSGKVGWIFLTDAPLYGFKKIC